MFHASRPSRGMRARKPAKLPPVGGTTIVSTHIPAIVATSAVIPGDSPAGCGIAPDFKPRDAGPVMRS
jgi:hypothetical protein